MSIGSASPVALASKAQTDLVALSVSQVIRTDSPYALPASYDPSLLRTVVMQSNPYASIAARRFRADGPEKRMV